MLDVRLLGAPSIRRADRSIVQLGDTGLHLFALLLLQRGRPMPRDAVAATLWGDGSPKRMARRVSSALSRLRATLEGDVVPRGTYLRSDPDSGLAVVDDAIEFDVARFEDVVGSLCAGPPGELGGAGASSLTAAVARYEDLMEGSDASWLRSERDRLRGMYLSGLTHLVAWHRGRDEHDAAAEHARTVLERDPTHEDMHRVLIELHAERGDHDAAMAQYRRCEEVLHRETGRGPHLETWLAVTRARRAQPRNVARPAATGSDGRDAGDAEPTTPRQAPEPGRDGDPALRFVTDLSRAIHDVGSDRRG